MQLMDIDASSLVHEDELNEGYQKSRQELHNVVGSDQSRLSSYRRVSPDSNKGRPRTQSADSRHMYSTHYRPTIRNLNASNTSHFYDSIDTVTGTESTGASTHKIQQSKHLPNWIWVIITIVLGIGDSNKYLATIIYMFTLVSALVFTFLGVMFVVYDVASKNSRTTVHIGAISLLLGFAWLCLGIYSFRLAGRLFDNKDFATSIRSHSRTLFKINSAVLLVLAGFAFTGLNLYHAFETYAAGHCQVVGLHHFVCNSMYISRSVFSIFSTVWNLMVGCMLLSVCRTHTIGIRRFIQDLKVDSRKYEDYWKERLLHSKAGEYHQETSSILENRGWFMFQNSDQTGDEVMRGSGTEQLDLSTSSSVIQRSRMELLPSEDAVQMRNDNENSHGGPVTNLAADVEDPQRGLAFNVATDGDSTNSLGDVTSIDCHHDEPPIMTEDEILLCYWKISSRMRFTSQCLQRWLASWIAFVSIWVGDYVVYWLSHSPDITDILEFTAPMLLLVVLCSAYAEANGEGQVMIRCICPTKERYGLLSFLLEQPLQMQVFSLSISYNALLTVILAFTVAFSSRLILDEVMKP